MKTLIMWNVWTAYQAMVDLPEGTTAEDFIAEQSDRLERQEMDSGITICDVEPVPQAGAKTD